MDVFRNSPSSIEEVLTAIAKMPTGRVVLKEFEPYFTNGDVLFKCLPPHVCKKLKQRGHPTPAFFVLEKNKKTIYYNPEESFAVLIPYLFHEIVHSIDRDFHTDKDVVKAELKAYHLQHKLTAELEQQHPGLRFSLRRNYPQATQLWREPTPLEIRTRYTKLNTLYD